MAEGFKISGLVTAIIGLAIAVMIFFALLPAIQGAISEANLSGAELILAGLVVTVFVAGIIMVILKTMVK